MKKENKELPAPKKVKSAKSNLNTIFKCPTCESSKPSLTHLKVHIGIVHYKEEVGKFVNNEDYGCKLCETSYKTRQQVVILIIHDLMYG